MLPKKDRAYNESRFSEAREAIVANSYQKVWGGEGEPALPNYEITLLSVFARHPSIRFGLPRLNLLTVSVNFGTLFDRITDLQRPVHPYPRTEISCHAVISHHAVIEPFVEFDSLARPQAPNLIFDLFESYDALLHSFNLRCRLHFQ